VRARITPRARSGWPWCSFTHQENAMSGITRTTKSQLADQLDAARHRVAELELTCKIRGQQIDRLEAEREELAVKLATEIACHKAELDFACERGEAARDVLKVERVNQPCAPAVPKSHRLTDEERAARREAMAKAKLAAMTLGRCIKAGHPAAAAA